MGTSQHRYLGYHQVNNCTMVSPPTRKLCYLALVLAFAISDTVCETQNVVCNEVSQLHDTGVLNSDGEIIFKKPRKDRQELCELMFAVADSTLEEKPYLIIDFSAGFNVPIGPGFQCVDSHLSFQVEDKSGNIWDSEKICGRQKDWLYDVYVVNLTTMGDRESYTANYIRSVLEVKEKNEVAKKAGFKLRYYMASEPPENSVFLQFPSK